MTEDPKQRLLELFDSMGSTIERLQDDLCAVKFENDSQRELLLEQKSRIEKLQDELRDRRKASATERGFLAEWFESRIHQQEQALLAPNISHETKRVMEIEISLLKRYRIFITEGYLATTRGTLP